MHVIRIPDVVTVKKKDMSEDGDFGFVEDEEKKAKVTASPKSKPIEDTTTQKEKNTAMKDDASTMLIMITLVLSIQIGEISSLDNGLFEDEDTSTPAGCALVLLYVSFSFTFVALFCMYCTSSMLCNLDKIKPGGKKQKAINRVHWLGQLCFSLLGVCLLAAEGIMVCLRYPGHWSSKASVALIALTQVVVWVIMYNLNIRSDD